MKISVMASGSEPMQVCSLPLPPVQYFQNYSDENIRRARAPKPPPIIQETYTMFGNPYNADDSIIRPLESQVCYYKFIIVYLYQLLKYIIIYNLYFVIFIFILNVLVKQISFK